MISDENRKSLKDMLKGKALYIALGVTAVAAGITGYLATDFVSPRKTDESTTKEIRFESSNEPVFTRPHITPYQPIEIDIPEIITTETPSTEAVFENKDKKIEEATERQIIFNTPMSHSIGKDFSMGIPVFSKTMKDYRTHNGVDFNGAAGENVKAIGEGKVISVDKSAIWGNSVTIDHGNGIISKISGLSEEALIENGVSIASGTVIGTVGTAPVEKEDEPHIHLEIRKNGKLCDPLEILGLASDNKVKTER